MSDTDHREVASDGTGAGGEPVRLTQVDHQVLADLARGGRFLASGAGQGPHGALVAELLSDALDIDGSVPVVQADELPPDAWVAHVTFCGEPFAMSELTPSGLELSQAVVALARHRGVSLSAVATMQAGGMNVVAGALAAHDLELPVVDGDLMGRAFPTLNELLVGGRSSTTGAVALWDARDDLVLVECDTATTERVVGAACAAVGGWAGMALCLLQARDVVRDGIAGSLTRAWRIGRALAPPVVLDMSRLVAAFGGEVLFFGTIVEARKSLSPSAPWAVALEDSAGRVARIDAVEQFVLVSVDGRTAAHSPDVICLLTDQGSIVDIGTLRPGLTVSVTRLAIDRRWYSAEALAKVGPQAFGVGLEVPPRR